MSPRELAREFEVAAERQKDDYNRDVALAWNVVRVYAMTMEHKRLPDLQRLFLPRAGGKRHQTRAEMSAALHQIANQHGLTVRTKQLAHG